MPFEMMNAQNRNFQREAKGGGNTRTHQQRSRQPWSLCIGDGVEIPQSEPGCAEGLPDEGQYPPDMVAGRKFRHHAAIFPMHLGLGMKRVA